MSGAAPRTVRKSRLEPYAHLIGTVPDKEIAEQAGVTAENVRTYRIRRGIPAAWRGETSSELAGKLETKAARGRSSRRHRKVSSRPSRLDPYRHLLGEVPDRELADMAGVSAENVRSYRVRRGIPARWRGDTEAPRAGSGPAQRRPAGTAPAASGPRHAYRVVAETEDGPQEYVTFGTDMTEAARAARERLLQLHPGALLREIRLLGNAL